MMIIYPYCGKYEDNRFNLPMYERPLKETYQFPLVYFFLHLFQLCIKGWPFVPVLKFFLKLNKTDWMLHFILSYSLRGGFEFEPGGNAFAYSQSKPCYEMF